MPIYQYEALETAGKPQRGAIDANSSEEAIQQIRGQGYFPTSVREQKGKDKSSAPAGGGSKPKKKGFLGLQLTKDKDDDSAPKKKKKGGFSLSIGGVKNKNLTLFTR